MADSCYCLSHSFSSPISRPFILSSYYSIKFKQLFILTGCHCLSRVLLPPSLWLLSQSCYSLGFAEFLWTSKAGFHLNTSPHLCLSAVTPMNHLIWPFRDIFQFCYNRCFRISHLAFFEKYDSTSLPLTAFLSAST